MHFCLVWFRVERKTTDTHSPLIPICCILKLVHAKRNISVSIMQTVHAMHLKM
jgi:hypothetical protein